MPIIHKSHSDFPTESFVTVDGKQYQADYIIKFDIDNDVIDLDNCKCVFSILNRKDLFTRQYVGAKFYEKLTNENVIEKINGYLPERVFCFTDTNFPLDKFLDENTFDVFIG
jgi:hypothetical protein